MPIRLRLTLGFAAAMALVFAASGFFVYARLGSDLSAAIDNGLYAHATAVAALVGASDGGVMDSLGGTGSDQAGFAQVLDPRGGVVRETSGTDLSRMSLLTPGQLTRARRGSLVVDARLGDDGVRLLARPVRTQDGRDLVVVVGAFLDSSQTALGGLRRELLLGGPAALVLASLIGYALATAALRPVERMRARAGAISAREPGQRLPVPTQRDEIGRLGHTLNAMLERLELGLERERAFVADASHELRTPLALLKTEIELALAHPRTATQLRQALRSAGEETDRLTQLSEDLLLLASADKGLLTIRREPLEFADLFATVALRFQRRGQDSGRRITIEPYPPLVIADPPRLEQALGNLVENALRYGAGTIRLFTLTQDHRLELHVTDEGQGFPDEFIGHAFERFSRADEARGPGGTGLGLAIVAAVAHAHGGAAQAANLAGGGADVWLSLPLETVEHSHAENTHPASTPASR